MLQIPLQDVPAQLVKVSLSSQSCQINIYQNSYGLFCDLSVGNIPIISGVICQNLNRIVRDLYLGFVGDLVFNDTQGASDPTSPGLGTRYVLLYLTPTDLGGLG